MLAGTRLVTDYDKLTGQPRRYERVFWWPDRCWVEYTVEVSLGRADPVTPADPNAALQPDRTLFRQRGRPEGQDATLEEVLHPAIAHLRDSGEWLTAGVLAAWAGIKPGSMVGIIQRYRSQLDAWPQQIYKGGRSYRITYYRFKGG